MKRAQLFCILLLVSLIAVPSAAPVHSQTDLVRPYLVKDINICTESSRPRLIAQTENEIFFIASQANIGISLWHSDGTESGTVRIKTFSTDTSIRLYGSNIWLDGSFYFLTTIDSEVYSLWSSDGTETGTRWVKDIRPAIDAGISSMVLMDREFYFVFWRYSFNENNAELWRSDGTVDGTLPVKAFPVGQYSQFSNLAAYQGHLYFSGWDEEHGAELWRSDGTATGTGLFIDLNPSAFGSPTNLFVSGDAFYFIARHESGRWLLWKSDGTQPGTQPILTEGYWPVRGRYAVLNNILYFPAENASGELRLWRTDGTSEGTWVLKDVSIETPQPSKFWNGVGTAGGSLYFAANQTELWKSDGTEAGTRLVKNLYTGNSTFTPSSFLDVGGMLYFGAEDWGERPVLWRSDGTSAGTNMVNTGQLPDRLPYLDAGPWRIQDNQVLFGGYAPCQGRELQHIDEALVDGQARASVVKDIETKTLYSEFDHPVAFQGKVFFTAWDGKNAGLLWSSDGSEGGTRLVEDFDRVEKVGPGPDYETATANNLLFFTIYDQGLQLWRTDGTTTGGLRLTSLPASYPQKGSHGLTAYTDKVFFFNDAAGYEALWGSDGSREGTHLLTDFDQTLVHAEQPVIFNKWIYFLASGASQTRLYRSDGTIAGTTVVRSWETSKINNVSQLVLVGNRLFFTAWDNDHGQELWVSDGTPAGTRLYTDVTSGQGSTNIKTIIAGGNNVFFVSQGDSNTWTLWKSTAEGRAPVRLLERTGVTPLFPTSQGGGRYLYFTTGSYVPRTLWRTDGTPAGTIPLNREISGYFTMEDFNVIGDRAYFNATDTAHGAELWTSDGTPEGTRLAFDLLPGPDSSNSEKITFVNGALWFRTDDGLHGSEPWVYDFLTEHFYLPAVGR